MKRILLSITATIALAISSYAQCVPDPQFTLGGIYPDSATGMPAAYVGFAYDEVITVVVPADTAVDLGFPLGVTVVPFNDITLNSITGFPPNFGYTCSPINCVFPGSSTGCVNITSSVNPVVADIGVYPLVVDITANMNVLGSNTPQNSTVDYYYIEILDSVAMGIGSFNDASFELKTIYPNPVTNNSKIQFITGVNADVTFTVTNVLGKTIVNRNINAKRGVNDIYISSSDFPNGIYLYSITTNGKTSTKRMIVRK